MPDFYYFKPPLIPIIKTVFFQKLPQKNLLDQPRYVDRLVETTKENKYMDIAAIKKRAQSLLEPIWVKIESDFKPFHREVPVAYNPISAFTYLVEMGKYPPPEIMVDLMEGFMDYFESNGDKSLDEALLGIKHTKYESLSYKQDYSLRFLEFELFTRSNKFSSLEKAAESYLATKLKEQEQEQEKVSESCLETKVDEINQENFLRYYYLWKRKREEQKQD